MLKVPSGDLTMAGMLQYGPIVIFAYAILHIYIYSYIGCIRPADLNISKHQEIWIQPPDNIYKYVLYNLLEVEKDREIT